MSSVQIALAASILLCSLVAGLVFAFAIVIMPGIKSLEDREFLKAFSAMDQVIQNNQPVFMFVWLGSAVAMIILAILGVWQLEGTERLMAVAFPAIYLLGVQLPTIVVNIPLNNRLQSLDLSSLSDAEIVTARKSFEGRWNFWNSLRTAIACIATTGLIMLAIL